MCSSPVCAVLNIPYNEALQVPSAISLPMRTFFDESASGVHR